LSFETSTGASASSMGDMHLWLFFVLFVAKMSQLVLLKFLFPEYVALGLAVK
jgi:hypothetical protein